ncbi:hypothetical protein [Halolamina sp.]|uniref:hypothetical protein n=1 Tax=Halolamina sp. TaxID=1940283 RepID=UPI00356A0110
MRRLIAALIAVCLLSTAVGAATMTIIDAGHSLTDDTAKANFEQDGYAQADLSAPNMTIEVAADLEQCGISSWTVSDTRNDFLCVTYGEDIDRTIRLFIPDAYWHPYVRESVDPVEGDATASFEPVQGGDYTAVEFTVTEPTTVVWPINADSSWFSSRKDSTISNLESVTGVGVAEQTSWQYANLSGNGTGYVIRAPNGTDALTVEYQTEDGEWATVPGNEEGYAPLYMQGYDGVDDRTVVVATVSESPQIRYKTDATRRDKLGAGWRELTRMDDRIEELFGIDIPFFGSDEEDKP